MKTLPLIFALVFMASAQFNYSGYLDTAEVAGWRGTATGTTRAFELSKFENILLKAHANDTGSSGYASDSIQFQWGIEVGDITVNTIGKKDTTWQERYIVDTFDILTTGNMVKPYHVIDTTGSYGMTKLFIDTVYVTGWAVQSREPFATIPWYPIYRFWYTGLAGNKTATSYVRLMFGQSRRVYQNVHNQ